MKEDKKAFWNSVIASSVSTGNNKTNEDRLMNINLLNDLYNNVEDEHYQNKIEESIKFLEKEIKNSK